MSTRTAAQRLIRRIGNAYADKLAKSWHPGGRPAPVAKTVFAAHPSIPRDRRLALACHLFYPDLLDEVLAVALRMPSSVDLYLTVVSLDALEMVEQALSDWARGHVFVRVVENRGRDIAPKYAAFPELYTEHYDLLLFLHTKKSTNTVLGPLWRRYLFDALAGSEERVLQVISAFDSDPTLGVISPEHFPPIIPWTGWGGNYWKVKALSRRMGIPLHPWDPPDFPSGSMFWARPSALAPIVRLGLQATDFPEEPSAPQDTVMHALERLVYLSAAVEGYHAATVPGPELLGHPVVSMLGAEPPNVAGTTPSIRIRLVAMRSALISVLTELRR